MAVSGIHREAILWFSRSSGILLHPTSLPSPFGIGDFGQRACDFVDFLASAGQSYWQVLPLSPTGYADSPYQGLSAFAGNPMLISPTKLIELGHLAESDLDNQPEFQDHRVDFGRLIPYKTRLLNRAFANFRDRADSHQVQAFRHFCQENAYWLEDFALFTAIKEKHNLEPWSKWEPELRTRESDSLDHCRAALADNIENHKYRQWQFFTQWCALKSYANDRDIRIIGDIPIFVSLDSADVWANPSLFRFDANLRPTAVSGVPPDYFSETGQLWGHPLYRWDVMAKNGYAWWIARFRMALLQADVLRIDHFRGFHNYWEVPASATTAMHGRWLYGPGAQFFRSITAALGEVAIIAEDLGDFDNESRSAVDALQNEFGYPGMRVLQFAFNGNPHDPFLPHNYSRDSIVYTGTHDNNTSVGWFQNDATEWNGDFACRYLHSNCTDIAWDLIKLAWSSVAHTAIATVPDLLSLSEEARMNTPGTVGAPNWSWRMKPGALNEHVAIRLRELTTIYGRLP